MSRQLLLDMMVKSVKAERRPASLIGGGAWTLKQGGTNFRDTAATLINDLNTLSDIIIDLAQQLGEGIVYIGAGYNNVIAAAARGVQLVYQADLSPYLPDMSSDDTENFIKECAKFDVKKVWEDPVLHSFPGVASRVRSRLGNTHLIAPLTWGPFTLAGQMIGVENLMRKMKRDPAAANAVFELAINVVWEFHRPFIENELVDIIYLPEPTASGDMISSMMLKSLAVPVIDKCLELYHKKGIPTLVHICGKLGTEHLSILNSVKNMDALSVDSKVPLENARSTLTNKCIFGNIDTFLLEHGSEEAIMDGLKQVMTTMAGHERFVVAPACDLAPGTPLSNVKTMFRLVRNYRIG